MPPRFPPARLAAAGFSPVLTQVATAPCTRGGLTGPLGVAGAGPRRELGRPNQPSSSASADPSTCPGSARRMPWTASCRPVVDRATAVRGIFQAAGLEVRHGNLAVLLVALRLVDLGTSLSGVNTSLVPSGHSSQSEKPFLGSIALL